jgi:hypothetical protein
MHIPIKIVEKKVKFFEQRTLSLYEGKLENLTIYYDTYFNAIFLNTIYLNRNCRKVGLGSEILQRCISFAHSLSLDLVLEPDPLLGTPLHILVTFYEKNNGVLFEVPYEEEGQKLVCKLFKWQVK